MSVTTKHLGFLIKNRGEYTANPETRYFKDNVVQYKDSSFICSPIDYDPVNNPYAYTTIAPLDSNSNLNEGWEVFAIGADTLAQQAIEEAKNQALNEINNAVQEYAPVQITGDVTNAADEEDITSVNVGGTDVLKLKDKSYNSLLFSGLGKTNLRKNIQEVTIEGVTITKNILTQAMMNNANTIYNIQYDYDLNGATITIPANCVLEFEGGSLSNGTIVSNGTINVQSDSICFHNIIIGNSAEFINDKIKLSWFKEDSDDVTDILQNLLDSNITTILIDIPVVFVSHPLVINSLRKNIFGLLDSVQKKSIIRVSEDWDASDYDKNSIFIINGDSRRNICNFNIVGIDFYGNHEGIIEPAYTFKANYAIYSRCIAGGSIDKCSFVSFIIAAIKLSSCEHFIVSNNYIAYCGSTLIGTIRKIDESNVLALLTENETSTTNQVALLRIFDNYSVYTNYGLLLFAGTDVQVYNNCISHTSCYGIYLYYVTYVVNIFNNYFEGNGKSTFWIDANGFSGSTGGSTMCEHLLNPHLGEGNYECACGWGVFIKNTLRIRPVISLATYNPSGLANVYGNMFSTAYVRSLNTYNTDNTVVGIDALISGHTVESTVYSNNTYFSDSSSPSPIFFVTGGRIRNQPINTLSTFKMRIMDIPERWINKDWCLLDNNYKNGRYLVIFPQDKEYKPCIKSAAYLKIGDAYNDLLSLAPYSKTINSVNYYSAITVANASIKNFKFKIPFEVFNESKIIKIILYNDSINSIGVKCELRRTVNGTEESMSQQYQYSADNITVNSKKFYTKHYFISAQDFTDGITDYIISVNIMSVVDTEDYSKLLFSLPFVKDIDIESTCSDSNYNADGQRLSGSSQQRPIYPVRIGSTYFDSSLGSNLWWNGTAWVDATGTVVS